MLENSVTWLAFCISAQLTKTTIHFLPSAQGERIPYKMQCSLTLLQARQDPITVVADGVRLGQPNGFRFSQIFPNYTDSPQPVALVIELSAPYSHINLLSSECIIELSSQFSLVRYHPKQLIKTDNTIKPLLIMNDIADDISLLSLNPMNAAARFSIQRMIHEGEVSTDRYWELANFEVPAYSVFETKIADLNIQDLQSEFICLKSDFLVHYLIYKKDQSVVSVVGV